MILPSGLCLGLPHQNAETDPDYYDRTLAQFDPSGFHNWKYNLAYQNYFRSLWRAQWCKKDFPQILATPDDGKIWFIGNEPHSKSQGDESPTVFVDAIQFWIGKIGRPFAIPGILQSGWGTSWWSEYLRLGGPKPDAYHIHIYAYTYDDWNKLLDEALRVFNDRPLIITECAAWNAPPEFQDEVMHAAREAVDAGKVESVFWFSSKYGPYKPFWEKADLQAVDESTTQVGESYLHWSKLETNTIYFPVIQG